MGLEAVLSAGNHRRVCKKCRRGRSRLGRRLVEVIACFCGLAFTLSAELIRLVGGSNSKRMHAFKSGNRSQAGFGPGASAVLVDLPMRDPKALATTLNLSTTT